MAADMVDNGISQICADAAPGHDQNSTVGAHVSNFCCMDWVKHW
jgi:hypothetical protein